MTAVVVDASDEAPLLPAASSRQSIGLEEGRCLPWCSTRPLMMPHWIVDMQPTAMQDNAYWNFKLPICCICSLLHTKYESARQTENRFLLTLRFEMRSSGATQAGSIPANRKKLAQSGPDGLNEIHHPRRCWGGSPYLSILCVLSASLSNVTFFWWTPMWGNSQSEDSFGICAADPRFHVECNDSHFHPHNSPGP